MSPTRVQRSRIDQLTCAEKLRIVADPPRVSVLKALLNRARTVSEAADALNVERNLQSHHLAHSRDAGFVSIEREGRHIHYSLARGVGMSKGRSIDLH